MGHRTTKVGHRTLIKSNKVYCGPPCGGCTLAVFRLLGIDRSGKMRQFYKLVPGISLFLCYIGTIMLNLFAF